MNACTIQQTCRFAANARRRANRYGSSAPADVSRALNAAAAIGAANCAAFSAS
jgi:hypothetical protein